MTLNLALEWGTWGSNKNTNAAWKSWFAQHCWYFVCFSLTSYHPQVWCFFLGLDLHLSPAFFFIQREKCEEHRVLMKATGFKGEINAFHQFNCCLGCGPHIIVHHFRIDFQEGGLAWVPVGLCEVGVACVPFNFSEGGVATLSWSLTLFPACWSKL